MKKLSFVFIALALLAGSCKNSPKKSENGSQTGKQATLTPTPEKVTTVTVADFKEKAPDLVGQSVVIEGTVDHVCKHGGQKMMLIAQNTENKVKITPDEKIAAFKPELEGNDVRVTGKVEELKVDENYLSEWEDEVNEGLNGKEGKGVHEGKEGNKENAKADQEENGGQTLQQIENLRKKLKESGKKYLSYYSVVCSKYETVKTTDSENK